MAVSTKAERMERRKKLLELRADEVEKLNTDVRERLIFLIYQLVTHSGRYEYLEKRYGISARRWQNVYNRAQLPGLDMLSSILKDYPYYSTWLMFGKAEKSDQIDPTEEGHINETEEGRIDPTVKGWEEKYERAVLLTYAKNQKKESSTN
jgi:hypothetical protein